MTQYIQRMAKDYANGKAGRTTAPHSRERADSGIYDGIHTRTAKTVQSRAQSATARRKPRQSQSTAQSSTSYFRGGDKRKGILTYGKKQGQ